MCDIRNILQSQEFHFLVGPDQTKITVHTAVIQNLSPCLAALMNNGSMKESIEGTAVLGDVDKETFLAFCEFAYSGSYTTLTRSDKPSQPQNNQNAAGNGALNTTGNAVGTDSSRNLQQLQSIRIADQEMDPAPGTVDYANAEAYRVVITKKDTYYCTKKDWIDHKRKQTWGIVLPDPNCFVNQSRYSQLAQFRALHFDGAEASPSPNPDLVLHGKLCVFADKYMIDGLRTQCLKSLHRDLCNFSLNAQTAAHVFDLLDFTFDRSGRAELNGGGSLRDLAIRYTICGAWILVEDPRFQSLLDRYPEVCTDLVSRLFRSAS